MPILLAVLSSCGGGGGGGGTARDGGGESSEWVSGVFETSASFKSLCEDPRSGTAFDDLSGSTLDENNWLRSWTNETYLWYDEVVDRDPDLYDTSIYFDLLKTEATTASGAAKDQFHFTYPTDEWEQLSESGVIAGYGFEAELISAGASPNVVAIVYVEPDTPASDAGLGRGDLILAIDGAEIAYPTQDDINTYVAGLEPGDTGELHSFLIQDQGTTDTRTIGLTSAEITTTPVLEVAVLPSASGDVGYILFNSHIATAEQQLIDAIEELEANAVTDLILDLRYNGGGLLAIASELSYMVAGATATNGQTFEVLRFNDKHPIFDPVFEELIEPLPFLDAALGFSATAGEPLPALDLPRVFVLATGNTCSASESIINGLRGIGIEVILIGDTTCGKPYGFYPTDNCGTTYFSIQFQGENAAGFGDYADGFAPADSASAGTVSVPGCGADDDLDHELGDPDEELLAQALEYRETGSCASLVTLDANTTEPVIAQKPNFSGPEFVLPKSFWRQNRDLSMPSENGGQH